MNVRIVSDSSSNIYTMPGMDFVSVPLKIITSKQEYVDNASLDVSEMVACIKAEKTPASTSCPNVGEWLDAFEGAECIFAVTISSSLSGAYNAAIHAAGEYKRSHPDCRICVLDSLSTGPEMQLIIEKLQELILAGHTFEEIRSEIREYMKTTHLFFTVLSMDNLAKNGRCSMALAKMAGVLGIRIIGRASSQGTIESVAKPRGERKMLETLLSELARTGFRGGKIRISHSFTPDVAAQLKTMILDCFPSSDVEILSNGGLCSYYADLGGMIIGYETEK